VEKEGLHNVLPNISDIITGTDIYHQYYTETDEQKYGVVAIGLSLNEPKIHESKLQSPYYEYIRDEIKIYEMRVYDEKRQKMQVGDIWYFTHSENKDLPILKTVIRKIDIYESFEQAIHNSDVSTLLPQIESVDEAIRIYEGFDNENYKIGAKTYGVVKFMIQKL
jgi:ASC-1-like (ASCH) protein